MGRLPPGLPLKSSSVSLADPNQPVPAEIRFEKWNVFDGIHFPTKRTNYHSGAKLAEAVTQGPIRINHGLRLEELATKLADFAPIIPKRWPVRALQFRSAPIGSMLAAREAGTKLATS